MSTQEEKRKREAAFSPAELNLQRHRVKFGCGLVLAFYLGACLILFAATRSLIIIVLALPAGIVTASWLTQYLYGFGLLLAVHRRWTPSGIRCLVIYSNSPNWEAHVREKWLPRLADVAVTLNWSERASWAPNLAVRIFRQFCGRRDFNPAVVVFQGLTDPLVFRFYSAFKQVKAGRPEYLQRLEAELFGQLEYGGGGNRSGRLLE